MEGLRRTLALAAFEMRLSRRMVRAWVLGILAVLIPVVQVAQLFGIHRFASGFNGSWANVTRDLLVLQPSLTMGAIMGLIGVFYVFDWRHRDLSRHFAATLDSSPLTRLQHAWGKFLGVVPVILAPMAILLVVQVVTPLAGGVHIPPMVYLACYLGFAVPVALTPPALAFGIAGLFRNQALGRALGIVAGVAWLAVGFGVGFGLAEKHAVLMGALVDMPVWSDWVGYQWSLLTVLQRLWAFATVALFVSLAACGPLGLTEGAGERRRRGAVVATLLCLVVLLSAGSGWLYARESARARDVVAAETKAAAAPRLTVTRRDLRADLSKPGRLDAVATLSVRNDTGSPVAAATLRLNPGLAVTKAAVDGAPAQVTRDLSVVSIALSLQPGASATLEIAYGGHVDARDADPGALLAVREASAIIRNNRRLFGTAPAYLTRRVAVLPMDSAWYPDPALLQGMRHPQRAFFDLAPARLTVTLPAGWTAAATGVRGGAAPILEFVSDEPVTGLALCAGRFEEAEMNAGGVTFRMLWHPKHGRNVEFLAPAREKLAEALAAQVEDVRSRTGLAPPRELSIVDVPQLTSTYVGTWDSPNRLGQPGLVLVKEGSLFGARFEIPLKVALDDAKKAGGPEAAKSGTSPAPPSSPAPDGASVVDPAQVRLAILQRFFASDFTGGSVPRLAMQSWWDARVSPRGEGQPILGPVLSSYVAETGLGRFVVDTSESARIINDQALIGGIIQATFAKKEAEIPDMVMRAVSDLDDAYAYMTSVPLESMDPIAKPREWAGVLYIKGRRPLLAIRELVGAESFGRAIGSLAGKPLTWTSFREAMIEAARPEDRPQLQVLLDNWLTGTNLPGFVVENVRAFRIQDEPERWQIVASIRNEGKADGLARLSAGTGSDALSRLVSVPAGGRVEAGLLSSRKADSWRLDPYLALNKTPPGGTVTVEDVAPAGAVPFEGQREAPPDATAQRVVVDNLDPGFSVRRGAESIAYNARNEKSEPELPAWNGWNRPGKWRRWRSDDRWPRPYGTFDATAAIKAATKDGTQPATWRATLPAGVWRVETWLPAVHAEGRAKTAPKFEYVVVAQGVENPVELTLDPAVTGWSDLGRFRFGSDAEVRLLDKGDGLVFADAVRFTKESE